MDLFLRVWPWLLVWANGDVVLEKSFFLGLRVMPIRGKMAINPLQGRAGESAEGLTRHSS